jgi:hypothetical protein
MKRPRTIPTLIPATSIAAISILLWLTVLFAMSCACSRGVYSPQAAPAAASSPSADPVRITMFYASPAQPPEDEKTLLCYGVENATAVRLEPPVDRVWPTSTRCLEIPTRAATYTLTAERGSDRVSQSVTVTPVPPKVKLVEVSINKLEFAPGEKATVCYKARNAVGVAIKPGVWIEPHRPDLGCVSDQPQHSTTYVVTATGVRGETDSERVTARVK